MSNEYEISESELAAAEDASADLNPLSQAVAEFRSQIDPSGLDLREEMVALNRVAKVVKGGRRFSFAALIVVGDGRGHVGVGFGKAKEVPDAIAKAVASAKKGLIRVPLVGRTIPFEIMGEFGAGRVLLKPASAGTGLIAGPAARAVLTLAGVQDVLTKVRGSKNQLNVVHATFQGLSQLELAEAAAVRRGKTIDQMMGVKAANRYRTGRDEALSGAHAVVFHEQARQDKTRRGTYSAGGRDSEENRD